MPDFLPRREADLLQWSANFDREIHAAPSEFALTAGQAADYRARHEAFAAAYQLANQPAARTPAGLVAKDGAKAAAVALARTLAGIVRAAPGVGDAQRIVLGLSVRSGPPPSRVRPPADAPHLAVEPIVGRSGVRVRLFDPAAPTRTAKPRGAAAAVLFRFVGEQPPADPARWAFAGRFTRTTVEVDVPPTAPSGAAVWVTAQWISPTGEPGPAAAPAPTRLAGGWAQVA